MERDRPHTRRPGGPLIVLAAIIGIIVVTVFVGYNLFHAKTMQQGKLAQPRLIKVREPARPGTELSPLPSTA